MSIMWCGPQSPTRGHNVNNCHSSATVTYSVQYRQIIRQTHSAKWAKITLKHCALCFAILYRMKIKTCIRTNRQIDEQRELNEKTSTTKQCPRINNGNGKHWRRQGGPRGPAPPQWPGKKDFFFVKIEGLTLCLHLKDDISVTDILKI